MKAPTSVLVALCEKTTNDIRACLNTLQVNMRSKFTVPHICYLNPHYHSLIYYCSSLVHSTATEESNISYCSKCLCGSKRCSAESVLTMEDCLSATFYQKVSKQFMFGYLLPQMFLETCLVH